MPEVSVIIPTCNRSKLLAKAIESVLNQTFKDYELIIVDDASQDDTAQAVGLFNDPRVRYERLDQSRGGATARNTGISLAKGEFIAFLDDDDEWLPEKLRLQMTLFRSVGQDVGLVYTGCLNLDRATGNLRRNIHPSKRGDLSRELLAENCVGGTSTVVIRRRYLDSVGGFDDDLPSFQDYDLWLRLSRICRFDFVPDLLVKYWIHQEKISTNFEAQERGMERMLQKYGASASMRRYLGLHYLRLGVRYCKSGRAASGRAAILRAIRLRPFEVKNYYHFGRALIR